MIRHALSAAALLVGLAHSGLAGETSVRKLKSNLPAWAEHARANGVDKPLQMPIAGKLGYQTTMPARLLTNIGNSTTGSIRDLAVVDNAGQTEFVCINSRIFEKDGLKHVDGHLFRINASGNLISAARAIGAQGKVKQSTLDLSSSETIRLAKKEIDSYLKTTPPKISSAK